MKLATDFPLASKWKTRGATHPLIHVPFSSGVYWARGQIYCFTLHYFVFNTAIYRLDSPLSSTV